jgi:hypothetical protein
MQAISEDLREIILSTFQAGVKGSRYHIEVIPPNRPRFLGPYTIDQGVDLVSIDKSRSMGAAACEIEIHLSPNFYSGGLWGDISWLTEFAQVTVWQWFGDNSDEMANAVQTFLGVIDKTTPHHDGAKHTITVTCRDQMSFLLDQGTIVTAPQDGTGAVLTPENGVFANMELSAIATELLTLSGFPGETDIHSSSYFVDSLIIPDGQAWATSLANLAKLVGWDSRVDELGTYHFGPPDMSVTYDADGNGIPDYTFTAGQNVMSLDASNDRYSMQTRVKVAGPEATVALTATWKQVWMTRNVPAPTGVAYDPTDTTHLRVLSGTAKRIYTLLMSTRAITATSSVIPGTVYPAGLSGDPSDSTILWLLDDPHHIGSGTNCKILKLNKSTSAVLSTWDLGTDTFVDIKADSSNLWVANLTTGKFEKRSKTDGSLVTAYGPNYTGAVTATRTDPSGIAIDGTNAYLFFAGLSAMWQVSTSAPTVVIASVSTTGTGIIGGDMDTSTHVNLYACSDAVGDTWDYLLDTTTIGSKTVSAVAIAGIGPGGTPGVISPEPTVPYGPVETTLTTPLFPNGLILRGAPVGLAVVTSPAQAATSAIAILSGIDAVSHALDIGIIANPGLQIGDLILNVAPAQPDLAGLWLVDSIQTEQADAVGGGHYIGVVACLPWAMIHV